MKTKIVLALLCMGLIACVQEMGKEGRLLPYGAIDNMPIARALPENTIARGQLNKNIKFESPDKSLELFQRGQQRYEIFCTPCHGLSGYGQGLIIERGFPAPSSFHEERLREVPNEYLFNVIRKGYGKMHGFADLINFSDTIAIVSYIRALQFSQNAHISSLPKHYLQNALRELK